MNIEILFGGIVHLQAEHRPSKDFANVLERPQNTPWRHMCNHSTNMSATATVKLCTDRACMGDEFRALKQVPAVGLEAKLCPKA